MRDRAVGGRWNVRASAWKPLTPRERRHCAGLQLLGLATALSTVAGIAAVMPFFAVLGDSRTDRAQRRVALAAGRVSEFAGHQQFALLLGAGFIALLVMSSIVNLAVHR